MKFHMQIAGLVAAVTPLFASTEQYFRAYLTEEQAAFSIAPTGTDLLFEQAELDEEARQEGFRRRAFTDPFLERAAIQRAFAEALFDHDTLLLHSSAVAVDGRGYLFTARSGTGKSTHTRLWREAFGPRAQMVNDDKPFLRITQAGVILFGSPWSGKHGLDSNIAVPLTGICLLERGTENSIKPIAPAEALSMLQKQSYCPLDRNKRAAFLRLVDKLAESVPLWRMECTKDLQAAHVAHSAMSKTQ